MPWDAPAALRAIVAGPDHAGPGGAVGILGGFLLLAASLIAAASRPASTAVTGGP